MKQPIKAVLAIALSITLAGSPGYADSVHLKGGAPTFTDNGVTATVCASLAGLGNGDLIVTLQGTGVTTTMCVNPAGNFAPGNPGEVVVGGQTSIPSSQIKNGNVSFCVTTVAPTCAKATDCGCPNNNWTGTVTDVNFTSLTLTVQQNGNIVFQMQVK